MQLCQDPIQQILEEEKSLRKNRERRLPPITEFQRDCLVSKAFTGIRYLCNRQFQQSAKRFAKVQICDTIDMFTDVFTRL
ncbi:PREDICTED: uncharacterized protein LOC108759209 isoform X1 [Trachymyrmex cornetzi]|uniref:uncharacterized protein LOC108759209 isoform X1 n=1 Tax=Trachymyrmex cornetzi TaxID=471704 RepID=UPI00084ED201|nr:PREDICTED: uncharacterized protein LOC108759209 isoform X1 [Trachymyrmex cornetzi]